jgi:hypothetical protein
MSEACDEATVDQHGSPPDEVQSNNPLVPTVRAAVRPAAQRQAFA